jgi:diguanylate cyclase (GGDEF)-like protein
VGRIEHQFTTNALGAAGFLSRIRYAIGAMCLAAAVLDWALLHHPLGPHGTPSRLIMVLCAVSSVVVGGWWILGRWPSYRAMLAFVVWADIGLAVTAILTSSPEARLCAIGSTTLIGIFAAFLLGTTVLIVHCVASALLVVGITGYSVVVDHLGWFELFPFYSPVLIATVIMPIVIQTILEGTRRAMSTTARQAFQDPMTGLHNRRGMDNAVLRLLHRNPSSTVLAVVIDVDHFKQLNDRWGHDYGDGALRAIGETLRSTIRSGDVAARLGGDEFAVIAALDHPSNVAGFIERIRSALATLSCITVSIGSAAQPAHRGHPGIVDELLRHADRAMYASKSRGGNQLQHTAFAD